MRRRTLVVLAVLLGAAVFALVRFDRPATQPGSPAEGKVLLDVRAGAVRGVTIDGPDGPISLERAAEGSWRLTRPFVAEADPREMETFLDTVLSAREGKVVEERGHDLARFGLEPPVRTLRLTIEGRAQPAEARLGRASPVGAQRYVALGSRVVLVDASFGGALERSGASFREMHLLPVDPTRIRRIEITRHGRRVVVERRSGDWRVVVPVDDRADGDVAERLARSAGSTRFTTVSRDEALRPDLPIAVRVSSEPGGPEAFALVGDATGAQAPRAAWRERGGVSGEVADYQARELEIAPDDLRERRLAQLSLPDVRTVAWSEAGRRWIAERTAEGSPWSLRRDGTAPATVDGAKLEAVLEAFRALRVSSFDPPAGGSGETDHLTIGGASGSIVEVSATAGAGARRVITSWRPGLAFAVDSGRWDALVAKAKDVVP